MAPYRAYLNIRLNRRAGGHPSLASDVQFGNGYATTYLRY
jgi:hypothetical protein